MLIGVWGNRCELMTLVLWSAAALPHADSLTFTWMFRFPRLCQLTSPVCLPPQGETDPEGTFSVLRPVDSSELIGY